MTLNQFKKELKTLFKVKNQWIYFNDMVNGHLVRLQFFNKYLHVGKIDGYSLGSIEFKTQKAFIEFLENKLI